MSILDFISNYHEHIRNIGLVAVATIGFPFLIWRTIIASRATKVAEANHISEMFTKSIEQLGALNNDIPSLERRIGAIYGLEKIAFNNQQYYPQIIETLCAYIRLNSNVMHANGLVTEDIQVAISVIGRCLPKYKHVRRSINLSRANLEGISFYKLDFRGAIFIGANLKNAMMELSDFRVSDLEGANLENARLYKAYFERVSMHNSNLENANVEGANFTEAVLTGANIEGVDFSKSHTSGTLFE